MIDPMVESDFLRSERANFDTLDATRHPDPRARAHTASHTAKYRLHADPSRTEKSMGICREAVAPPTRRQHKHSLSHKYGGAARCGQSVLLATLASALLRPERDQRRRGRSRRGWSLRGWSRREWSRRARCTPGCGCLSLAHNKHSRMRAVLLASTLLSRPQRDRR